MGVLGFRGFEGLRFRLEGPVSLKPTTLEACNLLAAALHWEEDSLAKWEGAGPENRAKDIPEYNSI